MPVRTPLRDLDSWIGVYIASNILYLCSSSQAAGYIHIPMTKWLVTDSSTYPVLITIIDHKFDNCIFDK